MMDDPMHPSITLGEQEYHRLRAVSRAEGVQAEGSIEYLDFELSRARIVPDAELSGDIVQMNSTVTYRRDDGWERTITLVYPDEADLQLGRMSVLSPVGSALIGLRCGQTITLMGWDGAFRKLTLLSVTAPHV